VIIENLRRTKGQQQLDLFADFDGLSGWDAVEYYQHEANWSNRMILGDSLQVMASLAEKENLRGKVQMIYIGPPYGIKFGSNWQVSTGKRDVRDGKLEDTSREVEQIKAFRDTWELGIHSYLSYLRDRLIVARDLLTESGSIFVQIGDENVHLVRCLLDEVFGSENFCSLITFKTTSGAGSFAGGTNVLPATSSYILWYAYELNAIKYRPLFRPKDFIGVEGTAYTYVEEPTGNRRRMTSEEFRNGVITGRVFRKGPTTSQTTRVGQTTVFPVDIPEGVFTPVKGGWKTNRQGMDRLKIAQRLTGSGKTLYYIRYFDDFPAFSFTNLWDDTTTAGFGEPRIYVVQTNTKVAERCLLMTTDPGDLVLDPTCGSGTTAVVSEQWGRRWITIDTSRVALALARQRIMGARFPYYLLADSREGQRKGAELSGRPPSDVPTSGDVRKGFVYERVPHVTLKSIANNPDIREGMSRAAIDAAIAKHAETEILYDRPYEDSRKVRVAGRFTVESLSPHTTISPNRPASEDAPETADTSSFVQTILDNLLKAGVQNGRKKERLEFEALSPFPASTSRPKAPARMARRGRRSGLGLASARNSGQSIRSGSVRPRGRRPAVWDSISSWCARSPSILRPSR
jgi:adenine-specific DNA-methyltransferase